MLCSTTNVQTFDVENVFSENVEEIIASLYHHSTHLRKVSVAFLDMTLMNVEKLNIFEYFLDA